MDNKEAKLKEKELVLGLLKNNVELIKGLGYVLFAMAAYLFYEKGNIVESLAIYFSVIGTLLSVFFFLLFLRFSKYTKFIEKDINGLKEISLFKFWKKK